MRNIQVNLVSNAFQGGGLQVMAMSARDWLSRPFEIDLEVVVRGDDAPSAEEMVGAAARLDYVVEGGKLRNSLPVHGIIGRAVDRLEPSSGLRTYRLRMVPELSVLSQVMLQGVFRGSVPQIVAEKLRACEVRSEFRLSQDYPERDYVAQFAETDLDFVNRLTEHLGIAYCFVPDDQGGRVVFTDDNRFLDLRRDLAIPFQSRGERTDVYAFETEANLASSLVMVADYNYRTPQTAIVGKYQVAKGTGGGTIEFGPHVRTLEEAAALARLRGEAIDCRRLVYRGESDRPVLRSGTMFTLTDHPLLGDCELLVVESEHRIEQPARGMSDGALGYSNRFVAIPATTPFRPERRTPVPRVAGLLNGVVLPVPGGDPATPWLDEQGRYRVALLFDTLNSTSEDPAARPIRLAQAQAGPGYGIHFPLRPGTEVVVGFVNGDVDRPLIVGAVPNPATSSPVANSELLFNRIRTATGLMLEFEDGT